jgi:hypothetical protein
MRSTSSSAMLAASATLVAGLGAGVFLWAGGDVGTSISPDASASTPVAATSAEARFRGPASAEGSAPVSGIVRLRNPAPSSAPSAARLSSPPFAPPSSPSFASDTIPPRECAPYQASGPPREFHFTRAIYSPGGGGGFFGYGRGGRAWCTDHPKAEEQFLEVLNRLTGVDAYRWGNAVHLDDPALRRYPILYMLEVGYMGMTQSEVEGLRGYLLAGGFLVVDDFWGTRELQNFEREIARVLPEYPMVDLPMDHPVYRTFYQVDEVVQVPAFRRNSDYARTWEQDGYEARNFGIFDDRGRLLVAVNWNTDLGDAWEWMEQPTYPLRFSTYAYQIGVNYIVYGMSN